MKVSTNEEKEVETVQFCSYFVFVYLFISCGCLKVIRIIIGQAKLTIFSP